MRSRPLPRVGEGELNASVHSGDVGASGNEQLGDLGSPAAGQRLPGFLR